MPDPRCTSCMQVPEHGICACSHVEEQTPFTCSHQCPEHCTPMPITPIKCHLSSCTNDATFEGWAHKLDPFTWKPSGMTMRIPVCTAHRRRLIGAQGDNA